MSALRLAVSALSLSLAVAAPALAAMPTAYDYDKVVGSLNQARAAMMSTNSNPAALRAARLGAAASSSTPFDAWSDVSAGYIENQVGNGRSYNGSIGFDYLFNSAILVGGFLSIDRLDAFKTEEYAISSTGYMVGPYIKARLTNELTLDATAAVGAAYYNATTHGIDNEQQNESNRAYYNATVRGQFGEGAIKFTPRVGITHATEQTKGYLNYRDEEDGKHDFTSTTVFAGPGVTYTVATEAFAATFSVNADIKSTLETNSQLSGAIEGAVKLGFNNGFGLSAGASYSGIGVAEKAVGFTLKASARF